MKQMIFVALKLKFLGNFFLLCCFFPISFQMLGAEEIKNIRQSIEEDFMTPQEWGERLYEYPRSIGCVKCHGNNGEERLLTSYIHKGKKRNLIAPRINNLDFNTFKEALKKDMGVMPRYRLTDEEISAIYIYISSKNKTPPIE